DRLPVAGAGGIGIGVFGVGRRRSRCQALSNPPLALGRDSGAAQRDRPAASSQDEARASIGEIGDKQAERVAAEGVRPDRGGFSLEARADSRERVRATVEHPGSRIMVPRRPEQDGVSVDADAADLRAIRPERNPESIAQLLGAEGTVHAAGERENGGYTRSHDVIAVYED